MYQKPFAYDNALLCFMSIGTFEPLTFCHETYYEEDISTPSLECLGLENLGLKSQKKISYLDK